MHTYIALSYTTSTLSTITAGVAYDSLIKIRNTTLIEMVLMVVIVTIVPTNSSGSVFTVMSRDKTRNPCRSLTFMFPDSRSSHIKTMLYYNTPVNDSDIGRGFNGREAHLCIYCF